MTIDEIRKDRYNIVITAMQEGLDIPYKQGWSIFLDGDTLYQSAYSEQLAKHVCHKSAITFTEFFKFVSNVSDDILKTLYGNIRLARLQRKLQKEGEDGEKKEEG
jgi:hypothetical protein